MKLINCPKCNDVVNLSEHDVRYCFCCECAGKYLDDKVTAVVTKDCIVAGIDNNGFNVARYYAVEHRENPNRLDFFFTGWIPNKPGEVIVVDSIEEVIEYDNHVENPEYISTSPTEF